jgi:hypothetical protein
MFFYIETWRALSTATDTYVYLLDENTPARCEGVTVTTYDIKLISILLVLDRGTTPRGVI